MQTHDTAAEGVRLEVFRHLFTALTEEMGAVLRRSAHSPNIKERRDYSCALFDGEGRPVALGDHMPVHLGALPMSVAAALAALGPLAAGDVALLNDPFRGGTHLPDLTLLAPVFLEGSAAAAAYVAARAHHADVGGGSAGSMGLAREIYQEGLRIPPVRLYAAGVRQTDLWSLLLANVRTPAEREGDLSAQVAALTAGARRLEEIAARRGAAEVRQAMAQLVAYAERLVAAGIERIPEGSYEAEDVLEDDGAGSGPLPIRVRLRCERGSLDVDFSGTAPQTAGPLNAVEAITVSCVRYVVRCIVEALLGEALPAGGGRMERVRVIAPAGTLVNARSPAAVAGGNVETAQRITDVLLLAFARALPELVPAQSQGTMNNLTVGGTDPRTGEAFAYYETLGGGMGGGPAAPGLSGVHVHMTNSLNTPIEALEHAYPLRVEAYRLRAGSGGAGQHTGGDGLRRDLRFLCAADVSVLSERRVRRPAGAEGGGDGAAGENVLIRDGVETRLRGKCAFRARPDDVLSLRTPGGGGWGGAP